MKKSNLLCGVVLLAGISISGSALADRGYRHDDGRGYGHGRGEVGIGFYFGSPYPAPYYPSPYYYPYPYYPPVMTVPVPAQPPVYIEQDSPQQAPVPQASNYWYHCDNPNGYYPYIKECPGGWQKVVPTPPPQQ